MINHGIPLGIFSDIQAAGMPSLYPWIEVREMVGQSTGNTRVMVFSKLLTKCDEKPRKKAFEFRAYNKVKRCRPSKAMTLLKDTH
jgi:hypothetical protein